MDSKLDYLAKSFSRATKKKYEHYVITAIYQKINNYELKPVTQQLVHSNTNPGKYYLLDLYFPQIKYGVEVDEEQHGREEHAAADIKRAEDIWSAIKCEERHVQVYDKSFEEIDMQIDNIVREVQGIISKLDSPLQWVSNEEQMENAFKNKKISVDDGIHYINYTTIWEHFTGQQLKNNGRCYAKNRTLPGGYPLWVPRANIMIGDDTFGNKKWDNTISENGRTITEKGQRKKPLAIGKVNDGEKRVVFMHIRDEFKSDNVIFMGVFQHVENTDKNTAVFTRISKEYTW